MCSAANNGKAQFPSRENVYAMSCVDCGEQVQVQVAGPEAMCPNCGCGRRFRAWGKRKRQEALQFFSSQPSVKRKRLNEMEDGRVIVSYVYDEVARYVAKGLLDIIRELDAIQLLLTGVAQRIGLPAVLLFPVSAQSVPARKLTVVRNTGRLDSIRSDHSLMCVLVREFFGGQKKCYDCDVRRYEHERDTRSSGDRAVERYPCWAGMTELSVPVFVQDTLVALFVTGQVFQDTTHGRQELEEGIIRLQREFPQLREGIRISRDELCQKGVDDGRLAAIWKRLHISRSDPLVIRSDALAGIVRVDAQVTRRLVSSPEELEELKRAVADAVRTVQEYVLTVYQERRTLQGQKFLAELFAHIECLPPNIENEEAIWRHMSTMLRRICNFQGFRYGVLCVPHPKRLLRLGLAVSAAPEEELREAPVGKSFRIAEKHYEELDHWGFDFLGVGTKPRNPGTQALIDEIHEAIGAKQDGANKVGWLGYLRLKERAMEGKTEEIPGFLGGLYPEYALLVLWERIPVTDDDPADMVSQYSIEFLQRMSHELSVGSRLWLSLLGLREAEESRRQLVANYVHGLKSAIHVAQAKSEILESITHDPHVTPAGLDIPTLLRSIRGDLNSFSYQIELTSKFTVLDSGEMKYAVSYLVKPDELIGNCVSRLEEAARSRGIVFTVHDNISADTRVMCDPGAIEVAMIALLDNAVKYSFDNKSIDVRLAEVDDEVVIKIEDFGQGISRIDSRRVFEKFYRGKQMDPLRYVSGTGIGLTVAQDAIQAHRGAITLSTTRGEPPSGRSTSQVRGYKVVFEVKLPKRKK